jgi:MFS family permease
VGFVNVHYPVMTGFLVLHLAHYGNSGPAAFSAYAAVILVARLFLGGLPDRLKPGALFQSGLACMAVGLVVVAMGPAPKVAVVATGLLGFGFSFPWSCVATTILKRTAAGDRGSVISALSAFYDAFVGGSAFIAGMVADKFGYSAAFSLAAGSLVIAAVLGRRLFTDSTPAAEAASVEQVVG